MQLFFEEGAMEIPAVYISRIYRQAQILVHNRLQPYGIGSGQYIFLLAIANQPGMTQKMISEQLYIDKATTTKAVVKLEKVGLVKRTVDAKDSRAYRLFMTEKGSLIANHVRKELDALIDITKQGFSDEEYETLSLLLKKMFANFNDEIKINRGG
jgi:DNA-binding MarR family transcriptional regulator